MEKHKKAMSSSGALFGRSDVARLLNIPEWTLANFADRRYPYGLAPSVRGGRGRGKKGLYSLADVYKIATAYRMFLGGLDAQTIGAATQELFPKNRDPMVIAVKERAANKSNARVVVIDLFRLSQGIWMTRLPNRSRAAVPPEWVSGNLPQEWGWITLRPRSTIADEIRVGNLRAVFAMPFDELLNWVDTQILGREVTFSNSHETKER
jgi:hypothetical protein